MLREGHAAVDRLWLESFDLVPMDCQLPAMDRYEATVKLRFGAAGDAPARVPIVAMTANSVTGDRDKCLLAGMDDSLSKPVAAIRSGPLSRTRRCASGVRDRAEDRADRGDIMSQVLP